MKPSSYRSLASSWETHVKPRWGTRRVGSIKYSEVEGWVAELAREKSATTVLRAYGILASLLEVAVKDRRISRNVSRGVPLPRKRPNSKPSLTHQQAQALADTSAHPELILFFAYTGLRWGEATAIRLRHVDRQGRRVSVEDNAVMVGGIIHIGTLKTHETRSVPYPKFLASAIAELCAGANVKAVQRMLGHASASMTLDTCAALFDDDLDDVAIALNQAHRAAIVAATLPPDLPET